MKFSNFRLIHLLLIFLFLVALIPVLVIAFQSIHCSRQAVFELQENALNEQLLGQEALLVNWISERATDLRGLQSNYCSHDDDLSGGCKLFNTVSSRPDTYKNLFLYDANWKLLQKSIGFSTSDSDLLSKEDRAHLKMTDELLFFRGAIRKNQGEIINIGCRLFRNKKVIGYVVGVMDISFATQKIFSSNGTYYRTLLFNKDGYTVFPKDNKILLSQFPKSLKQGSFKMLTYSLNKHEDCLAVSKLIPRTNWLLVTQVSKRRAMYWLYTLRNRNILTSILVLISISVLIWILAHFINQPFYLLNRTAKQVSSGALDVRMPIRGVSESQELAHSFNRMLDDLHALHLRLSRQEVLAEMGQLTSSIVHEFRNPLSSISMNVKALHKKVKGDALYTELAEISIKQVERMKQLLSELLKYGKPTELKLSDNLLSNCFRKVREDAQSLLLDKQLSLEVKLSSSQIQVHIDLDKFRQIFYNLIENACHACEFEGELVVSSVVVGKQIRITLTDDGPGIPKNMIQEVFLPFISAKPNGTGLGLSNVKRYVEMHGGTIFVRNRANTGAEFTIFLPIIKEN